MDISVIKSLEDKGFKRWQKNGMDRMYINADALGLSVWRYKSGNVQYAEFDGEQVSNSRARAMLCAKTYIDLVKNRIVSDDAFLARKAAELSGLSYEAPESWEKTIKLIGEDEADDSDSYENRRSYRSASRGDYSPSSPWNAPGMSVSDFIRGVC